MIRPGDRLGEYEILSLLGAGGMGAVYLARDTRLDRQVALKVLPESLTADAQRVARFEREARAASGLNHPNICTIHAFGETASGERFIVMERVEGVTLRTLLERRRLPLQTALDHAIQVAAGVAAAHSCGVVHRDLKPENLVIRPDGLLKILDFGLAKLVSEPAVDPEGATRAAFASTAGQVVGTVHYMSPEQARGQEVDERTDIWSIGVLTFEMVAGRLPFTGPTASDVIASVLQQEPTPLARFEPDVPSELQRIVGKCLRKDPGHRYQTVKDLGLDLEALRDGLRSNPRQISSSPAPKAGWRGSQTLRTAAIVVAVATLGAVAWKVATPPSPGGESTRGAPLLKRLTFDDGLQTDPTFSPDGRFIAYASDRSGNFDIWVQPVEGGDPVQITKDSAQDVQPAWSPDGGAIVFRSEREGGGIFVVPALGGRERQISPFGTHPSWLDRSEVLLVSGNVDAGVGAAARLFVASLGGDAPREVLGDFTAGGGWYWAAGHPDGRISLLGQHRTRGVGFFTVSRDGSRVTQSQIPRSLPLDVNSLGGIQSRFCWSPMAKTLYLETPVDGVQNLWRIAVDPVSLDWKSAERLTTGPGRDGAASVSNDGRRLAYVTTSEQTRVYVQALTSNGYGVTGPLTPVTEADAEVLGSAFDPKAERLAYIVRRSGSARYEFRVASVATGQSELLDEDLGGGAIAFIWMPDGRGLLHILVRQSSGSRGTFEAALMRHVLGGQDVMVIPWRSDTFFLPSVWPSGDTRILGITISGSSANVATYSIGPKGLTPERVLFEDPAASLWQPGYSPDRRWISFVRQPRDQTDRTEIMVGPVSGGGPRTWKRIAPDHQWPDKPRWSRDGRTMYFISRYAGAFVNLWAVPIDPTRGEQTGAPRTITHFDSASLVVSPHFDKTEMDIVNGRVALTMTSRTGSIWMLDHVETSQVR